MTSVPRNSVLPARPTKGPTMKTALILSTVIAAFAVTACGTDAESTSASESTLKADAVRVTEETIATHAKSLAQAAATLRTLATQETKDELTIAQRVNYSVQSAIYVSFAEAFEQLAGNFGDTAGLNGGDMVQKMAAMNMQFLALQEATQMESRRFQTLSNASKSRHEAAMGSIRNMK